MKNDIKIKAASKFKVSSKLSRAAKRMKIEVASSAEVEDSNKENEQTLIQVQLAQLHFTLDFQTSVRKIRMSAARMTEFTATDKKEVI